VAGPQALGGRGRDRPRRDPLATQRQRGAAGDVVAQGGQDVVDDHLELTDVDRDLRQAGAGAIAVALGGQVERDADPGQRGAQLVGDVGQELALAGQDVLEARPPSRRSGGPARRARRRG
jgi:hypothetical protein